MACIAHLACLQGPLLEAEGKQIGVVTAIAAPAALRIRFSGDPPLMADMHSEDSPCFKEHTDQRRPPRASKIPFQRALSGLLRRGRRARGRAADAGAQRRQPGGS